MRRAYLFSVFMLILFVPHPSNAQDSSSGFFSTAYLMELCRRDNKGKEVVKGGHAACQSYISGIIDYHGLMTSLGTAPTIDFCVPNTERLDKIQDQVWLYLIQNKQHAEFIAAPAVALALYEYYPCPEVARKKYKRQ
jgi:hypothetical protein